MRKTLTLLSILGILFAFSPPPSYAQSIDVAAFSKDGELWTVDNSVSTFNATATTTLANLKVWANGSQSTAVNASNENQTANLLLTINATDIWTNGAQSNTVVLKSAGGGVSYRAGISSKIWANGAGSSAIWSESGGGSLSVSAADGETMEIWTSQPGVNTIRTDSPDVELRNLKARASGNRAGALWVETATPSPISVAIHNSQLGAGKPVFSRWLNTVHITSAGDSENINIEINGSKIWTDGTNSSAIAANPGTGSVAVDVKGSEIWANQSASSAIFATSANSDSGTNAVVVKVQSSRVWSGQNAGRDSNVIRAQTTGAGKIYVEIRDSTVFEDSRLSFQARSAAVMMNSTGQGGIGFVASGSNIWSGGINSKTIRAESAGAIRQDTTLTIANGSNVWANGTEGSAIFVNSHRFIGITISGSNVWSVGEGRAAAESNSHHSAGSWTGARAEWVVANGSKVWANGAGTGAIYMNSQRAPGSGIIISGGSEVWTEGDSAYSIYGNASERNQYIEVHSHSRVWANGAGSTAIYANSADGGIDDFARVIVNGSSRVFTTDEMSNAIAVDTEAFANIVVHDGSRVWTNGAKSNAIFIGFGIGDSHMRVSGRSQVYTTGADSNAIAITDGFAGARSYVYVDGGSRVFSNGARSAAININAYNRDAIANISGGAGVYATGVDSAAIMLAERARSSGGGKMELYISGGANVSADGQNSTAVFLRSGRAAYYKTIMKVFEDGLVCSGVIDAGRNCLITGAAGAAAVRIRDDGNADDDPADYHSILENAGTIVGDVKLSDYHDRITNKDTGVITMAGSFDTGTGEDTFRNDGIINGTGIPINFGGGDDYFINNGTMVIGGEGFAGLEKITFGENSLLLITADPVEMVGRSLINVEDEIAEADIEGFSARFANPERLSGEFLLFREEILVDSEDERQAIFNIVSDGLERNASARMDEIGNIFITLSNLRPYDYLRNYDAMIQSAYYADNAFSEKLRGGCYGGGDETETQDLRGGCLWAAADGRFTRHTATSEYSEDAHVFTGGFTVPAGKSIVSVAAGYETSDFDAGADTSAGGERFMAGISVASEFWSGIITDVRTQFARATWESAALRGESLIRGDNGKHGAETDVATWSAAVGGEMPIFPGGVFMVVPRVEAGVTKVSADGFRETALEDSALTVGGAGKTYLVISPSVTAYVPAGETVNIWMSLGADAHITDPETQWSARTSGGDLFKVTGSLERIMVNYGAGAEFVLPYKGFNVRIDYDGGVTPGLDTLTQVFSARVGLAF